MLEPALSTFVGAPGPRAQTRIYEQDPEGLKATVVTVNADGSETTTSYVAQYDGVEYPFRGGENVDAVVMRREGPYAAVAQFRHAGRVVGEARRTISTDRSSMTVTVRINDNINRISVFKRRREPKGSQSRAGQAPMKRAPPRAGSGSMTLPAVAALPR